MLYLYLDESGDLGFDFFHKKPSKFFTISILVVQGTNTNRQLANAVKKTLKRKLNNKVKKSRYIHELKGTNTTLDIKKYLFKQIEDTPFNIYTLTLNKRRVYTDLSNNKERLYNFIARLVLEKIKLDKATVQIDFIVDKCKSQKHIKEFNDYVIKHLESKVDPKIPINIVHENSQSSHGLQLVDLFSWGIFKKYEKENKDWYNVFKKKIKFEDKYL